MGSCFTITRKIKPRPREHKSHAQVTGKPVVGWGLGHGPQSPARAPAAAPSCFVFSQPWELQVNFVPPISRGHGHSCSEGSLSWPWDPLHVSHSFQRCPHQPGPRNCLQSRDAQDLLSERGCHGQFFRDEIIPLPVPRQAAFCGPHFRWGEVGVEEDRVGDPAHTWAAKTSKFFPPSLPWLVVSRT